GISKSVCPMGCSCRMFREEPLERPCVSWAEPFIKNRVSEEIAEEGSRNPALWESGRGSRFWQRVRPGFFTLLGTRLMIRTLGSRARNGRREKSLSLRLLGG